MGRANTYTLYDLDGKVLGHNMPARDVAEITGVKACSVSQYGENGTKIRKRWMVEIDTVDTVIKKESRPKTLPQRWESAVAPFRDKVTWVKQLEPGVKKLSIKQE
ncbi:MAG: hypothetical protein LUE92_04625 [Clostridiales bacterium]|nr:hypothetical protein [Clostridiales bacterium]